jgi:hypothetical protein
LHLLPVAPVLHTTPHIQAVNNPLLCAYPNLTAAARIIVPFLHGQLHQIKPRLAIQQLQAVHAGAETEHT